MPVPETHIHLAITNPQPGVRYYVIADTDTKVDTDVHTKTISKKTVPSKSRDLVTPTKKQISATPTRIGVSGRLHCIDCGSYMTKGKPCKACQRVNNLRQ